MYSESTNLCPSQTGVMITPGKIFCSGVCLHSLTDHLMMMLLMLFMMLMVLSMMMMMVMLLMLFMMLMVLSMMMMMMTMMMMTMMMSRFHVLGAPVTNDLSQTRVESTVGLETPRVSNGTRRSSG